LRIRTPRRRRPTRRSPLTPVRPVGRRGVRGRLDALPRPARLLVDWGGTLLVAVGIVLVARAFVVTPYRVPSAVMEPTLHCERGEGAEAKGCTGDGADRVLVNRFLYRLREPKRGDIVAVEVSPQAARQCGIERGEVVLHRVVGLPGETLRFARGSLSVDGERLPEPYVAPARRGRESGTWRVPADRYFLLGDNRVVSCDSRRWGAVSSSSLVGSVFARYWPSGRIGLAATLPG
jgi:signal peptidase I